MKGCFVMSAKMVMIIQCDISRKRCSGFYCMNDFYNKENHFANRGYSDSVRYIALTCGGCPGKNLAAQLEQFSMRMKKYTDLKKSEIYVHLASCMTTDNHHSDRCPHLDFIKNILLKHGYDNIIEGTYISKNAQLKREQGIYKTY